MTGRKQTGSHGPVAMWLNREIRVWNEVQIIILAILLFTLLKIMNADPTTVIFGLIAGIGAAAATMYMLYQKGILRTDPAAEKKARDAAKGNFWLAQWEKLCTYRMWHFGMEASACIFVMAGTLWLAPAY